MSYIATLANWDALLQEDYIQEKIVDQINIAAPFRDKLKRTEVIGGRELVYGVKVGASQGQGARAESATMPQYGAGEYQDCTLRTKYNYAPFKITGPAEEFGSRKAFVKFAMKILSDTKEGMLRDFYLQRAQVFAILAVAEQIDDVRRQGLSSDSRRAQW